MKSVGRDTDKNIGDNNMNFNLNVKSRRSEDVERSKNANDNNQSIL
jgi:hypothetical protein